ncbi:GSU2403 family nucleotidyltransferase fold protein [Variovorax sp. RCC_210]|uniref:GSU2403 family nucleotidyltransferase fold protein n=1 Tax=Variovorax sp. RCC_210 TaxID=3239217 RepID=UPI003526AF51
MDGRISCMPTINPQTFVEFKRWMSEQPDREFLKRGRDRRQAEVVQQLTDEGRFQP